jgi:hypothetical protein
MAKVELRGRQEITFTNMTPEFWRLARPPTTDIPTEYHGTGKNDYNQFTVIPQRRNRDGV